jgi:hypothetical protein
MLRNEAIAVLVVHAALLALWLVFGLIGPHVLPPVPLR